jgi:RNA recognition motif-containing protein
MKIKTQLKAGNRLFVGGLSWNTTEEGLREAFEKY